MSTEQIRYALDNSGRCVAWGIEVAAGQVLPAPPDDPFGYRWNDGKWEQLSSDMLPAAPVPIETQLALLQAQVAELAQRIEEADQ